MSADWTCSKCGLSTEPQLRAKRGNQCKRCRAEYTAQWRSKNPERARAAVAAWHEQHREELKEYRREYYKQNIEARREYRKAQYAANRELAKQKTREWVQANQEHVRERERLYYMAHRETARQQGAEYYRNNLDKYKAFRHARKARKRNAAGKFTGDDVKALYLQQRGKCAFCRHTIAAGYHIDHIMPLVLGGSNWPDNIQLLCQKRNLSKGGKDPIAWANENGRLF